MAEQMIKVVIIGRPSAGRFFYRIETEGTRLAVPFRGLSAVPLMDACGHLRNMRAVNDGAVVGLFLSPEDKECKQTATVGWGDPLAVSVADIINDGLITRSEEPPPQPSISQEPLTDMGPSGRVPDRPVLLPRRRKPRGSGGRRGAR